MINVEEYTSPVWSAVQAWRNVSSKPLWVNAEVSACRMRSFDVSDAVIVIISLMNLRKSSVTLSKPAISYRVYCTEMTVNETE